MSYQAPKNVRRESRTLVGRFRGGKLVPVMAVPVRGNEGGLLSQKITMELDPIAGRMITPISGEFISVFVPVQAMDAIKDPDAAYPGMTEVVREKLLSGNPLFNLDNESEISKRCGVNPRPIRGTPKVSEMVRLAHNAAVNYLRQRKYVNAVTVDGANREITPALISQTVLERLNGVLDPEDRVNGAVEFDIPNVKLPVKGLGLESNPDLTKESLNVVETGSDELQTYAEGKSLSNLGVVEAINGALAIYAQGSLEGSQISLTDFYNAETMDRLTRVMRKIVDDNPEYGEEMALRWAHGLSVDTGKLPFVISEQQRFFGRSIIGATDTAGVQDDVMRSDMMLEIGFNVPIPRTELGGIIITFATLKPDETIPSQPHPYLSDYWKADNFAADELSLDPVRVVFRDLDSNCAQEDETKLAFFGGFNGLKRTYVHYGFTRNTSASSVENKTAIWQLEVPMSVTPQSVLYPDDLDHYPFADQLADVCTYVCSSQAVVQTPTIFGPTPVEDLAALDGDEDGVFTSVTTEY